MPEFIYNFIDFWKGDGGRIVFLVFKISAIAISAIMLYFIIFFLRHSKYLWNLDLYKETIRMSAAPKGKISKKWHEVLSRMNMPEETSRKMAIVEADILVDSVLKILGFSGETLNEKIEKITSIQLKSINDLKMAHAVRKDILYNPDYEVSPEIAKETIDRYEKVLREIDVL
jgi:hypothetical protein